MTERNSARFDRTETSLWPCVHDADLLSLASDRLNQTVTVLVRVFYINSFHNLPSDTSFAIVLQGVESVRAMRHESWPGQSNLRPDLPWDEAQALRSELYAKGRLDSISWSETESLLLRCKDTEIMNGVTAEIHSNRLSLTVEAYLRDPAIVEYLYLTFEFKDAYVSQGDDKRISIPEFLSLGEAYWEAFASRSRELASKVDTANQNIQ